MSKNGNKQTKCAEHGIWTPAPKAPPAGQKPLDFNVIDADENKRIISSGEMSFAMVGCSGDPEDGTQTKAVAHAIAAADDTSFFYHLGDIIYFEKGSDAKTDSSEATDTPSLWNSQLYAPYKKYPKQIVSIPGNHDGKSTPITNYFGVFCSNPSKWPAPWSENKTDKRPAMIQPYVYWRLNTPLAYIVGLYSNIANSGILDDPTKYSDFTKGPPYLAVALQKAFADSGQRPDAIFSAHAHLFQRLTYTFADGSVMPCLVAGCGGHAPLELLFEECDGSKGTKKKAPFPAVAPGSFQFPKGDSAQVEYYEDNHTDGSEFGFLKVTIKGRNLKGEFIGATSNKTLDKFKLDLDSHKYK